MHQSMIELLGQFRINLDGNEVGSDLRIKTQALLAYLVIEAEKIHRRDSLASLLWPDKSNETALTSLRQAISQLRSTISPLNQYLHITSRTIQFRPENQSTADTARFRHLIDLSQKHVHATRAVCAHCVGLLEDALVLYKGTLLSGFFVKDAPEFDDWLTIQQQAYERMAISSLTDMAEYYLQQGRFDLAGQTALRQIEMDP